MKEKERYIVLSGRQIKDTTNNSQDFLRIETVCKRLNQQDKENQQLKQQLARIEKALELAVEQLDDAKDMLRDAGKNDWAGMIDTSVDYFKARAKEMLKSD